MRILILNQYFPPDPAPTGILFAEIAEALRASGHEVECVDSGQEYRGGQNRGLRLLREMFALVRMLSAGLFQKRRFHAVLSGSSPPCLAAIGALVSVRHWAPHLHWCMDLYPEIAVALREIPEGKIARFIRWLMKFAYRNAHTVVGLDGDMVQRLNTYRLDTQESRPWVPAPMLATLPSIPSAAPPPTGRWTWLYSGNLGRAHEWQTLLSAQAELETRGVDATLAFQGGGPAMDAARQRAEELGLKQVEWRPYVHESDLCATLLDAHCLIVTERPEVKGLLWPSKLAFILGLPRLVLFVGPLDGAIASLLHREPHCGVFAPGDFASVANWIESQRKAADALSRACVTDVRGHRERSIAWWCNSLERTARR